MGGYWTVEGFELTVVEKVKAAVNPQASFEQLGRRITWRENVVGGGHGESPSSEWGLVGMVRLGMARRDDDESN